MGIFDAIGGRPEANPERAFDVGAKFGEYRRMNSAGAKLQGVMDAHQKGVEQRQTNKINEQKVRNARVMEIIQDSYMAPEGSEQRAIGEKLVQTMNGNPAMWGSFGIKTSTAQPVQSEAEKRGTATRLIDFKAASKANDSLSSADAALTQLDNMFQEVMPSLKDNDTEAIAEGLTRNLKSIFGGDKKLRAYNDLSNSLSTVLSKGLFREVGVLTDADRATAKKALPNSTDSKTTYGFKIRALRNLIDIAKANYTNKRQAYIDGVDFVPQESGVTTEGFNRTGGISAGTQITNNDLFEDLDAQSR